MEPSRLSSFFVLSTEVIQARRLGIPLVALESAVITHGLPRPENLSLARDMESEVREQNAIPATIALIDGKIHVGLNASQLETLAEARVARKISRRDFAIALTRKEFGGTTVAGTLFAAHTAGIKVFATGGIGGVHRGAPYDVSADLPELSRTPVVVVCSGAKSILDLPATLEYLETVAVPVIGFETEDFPAFYTRHSGLKVDARADTPQEIASIAQAHWDLGMGGAVLVVNPPPVEVALSEEKVNRAIQVAVDEAARQKINGPAVTPFLLTRVSQLTGGASLRANLGLLKSNARLAAQIAAAISPRSRGIQSV